MTDSPLDNMELGDEFLRGEASEQIAKLYANSVLELILQHFNVPKRAAYRWCQQRFGKPDLHEDCLPELVPSLRHRFVVCNIKFHLKRLSSLTFEAVRTSAIGETVAMYEADDSGVWLVTNLPFLSGPCVVGRRSFPLTTSFTGYVVANQEDESCYVISPLRHFLTSSYLKE
jgi:hypothetical protein